MTKNMHTVDRVVRLAVVALIAVLYFTGQISGLATIILGVVAAIFALTSFVGLCPLYSVLGISTRRKAAA
ncbi:MAG: DUF2892 domain-containing protein [Bacteroidota bacterium]